MAGLDRLLVGGDRQLRASRQFSHSAAALRNWSNSVSVSATSKFHFDICCLVLEEHVAVGHAGVVEREVVHAVLVLDVHRQPLEPVGQLARDRLAVEAAHLLEIGELGHLHPVAPDFPAEPPGAERRAFPVVLDEADVVRQREVDADRGEAAEVQLLQVGRARLQDHLILVIMLQPVGVLAIAAVGRAAARLDEGGVPRLRARARAASSRCGRCPRPSRMS